MNRRAFPSLWIAIGAAAAALISCTGRPVAPAKPATSVIKPDAWPARRVARVFPVESPRGLSGIRFEGIFQPNPTAVELQQASDLVDAENAARVSFEGDGSFIFRPKAGASTAPGPTYFVYMSAEQAGDRIPIQRTWFAVHEPSGPPRGIALLMPGLFGTPLTPLDQFTSRLHAQGWVVVRMMCQPSRFTERVSYSVDLAHPETEIARVAHDTDDRVAECAYAAQAALAHVEESRPDLARLPRIAVGMSGGAMTLPTVLAREPDRYAAAVIIAGGCDYFAITRETNYTFLVDSVHYQWTPAEPTTEQVAALDAIYLAHARLDSYYTAESIRGKPILMLHADHDGAVPAHLGDLLWERLGKPERWVQTAGHEELFMRLPRQMDRVMAWIDAHAAPGR